MMTLPSNKYVAGKIAVSIFLAGYALLGFAAHITKSGEEDAYPFFSWFLFVTVPPRHQSGFDIQVTVLDGKPLASPVSILDRPDIFPLDGLLARDLVATERDFGRAIEEHRDQDIATIRRMIESHFRMKTTYRVREIEYETLNYFLTKEVATSTVLATFSTP